MNLVQAETAIVSLIFRYAGTVEKQYIQYENRPNSNGQPFVAPNEKPWCRVSIQYSNTQFAGFGDKPEFRDFGIISIQCFVPKESGTLTLMRICQEWRDLLEAHSIDHLEIYLVHAPRNIDDDNFYGKIMRAEFRVN